MDVGNGGGSQAARAWFEVAALIEVIVLSP